MSGDVREPVHPLTVKVATECVHTAIHPLSSVSSWWQRWIPAVRQQHSCWNQHLFFTSILESESEIRLHCSEVEGKTRSTTVQALSRFRRHLDKHHMGPHEPVSLMLCMKAFPWVLILVKRILSLLKNQYSLMKYKVCKIQQISGCLISR